jgi:hypothetical protein
MIDIRIEGKSLELGPDFSIQIELASPLFTDVIGYSSHSLKFRIPLTPRNRAIFDHADCVLSYSGIETYNVDTYLAGQRWREGFLNLESFAMDSISVSLDLSEAKFSRLLREKRVQDYELGGARVITAPGGNKLVTPVVAIPTDSPMIIHATDTVTGSIDTHDYVFYPVRNETMYAGNYRYLADNVVPYDPWNYINWWRVGGGFWDELRQAFSFIFSGGAPEYYAYGRHPLVPFPYLVYVMRKLAEENGFQLDESSLFISDPEIQTLTILNPATIDKLGEIEFSAFSSSAWYSSNSNSETIDLSRHVPTDNSRDFWGAVQRQFGLATIVKDSRVEIIRKKDHANAKNQIDWRKKLQNYSHFYAAINRTYGTDADSGDRLDSETVSSTDVEVTAEVLTQADLPLTGVDIETVYYVIEENAFYKYELIQASQPASFLWNFLGYRSEKVVIGSGEDSYVSAIGITQKYSGLWTELSPVHGEKPWVVPQVDMPLISVPYNQPPYDFGAKLCFYRGLRENVDGDEYPYGSSDCDLAQGDQYSLQWHGDGNLYDVWHRDWVEMLQAGRDMTLYLNLSFDDVLEFDWTKKPRIRVADGEVVTLIKSMRLKITNQGLQTVEAEAIRI